MTSPAAPTPTDPGPIQPAAAAAPAAPKSGLSRRRALGLFGGGAVAVGATALVSSHMSSVTPADAGADSQVVPFHGAHQAGITTLAQERLYFAAFDITTDSREDLIALLKQWSAAAANLTAGQDIGPNGAAGGSRLAPPDDTGEAVGLAPGRLTLSIGFGASMFLDAAGKDRFGIADRRPAALVDLPHFAGDAIDASISAGDICVQACSEDPQVAIHAIRNLVRIGFGTVTIRWSQLGFGRTASTSTAQATPRNLFGFKDGTNNIKAEDDAVVNSHVWVQPGDGAAWMTGGSYLVSRRIKMIIETWDRTSLQDQEAIMGRDKGEGAPLSGGTEFTAMDLTGKGPVGEPAIAIDSHIRLAHPTSNKGAQLLRRGYNFVDGTDGLGRLNAGLFFLAYQRDPRTAFIPIQTNLAGPARDSLNEYIRHVSSGLFACPPGIQAGGWWGQSLFA
jgi:deferrochelatase/peroxidase EfeB